ncbi:hypothetical protein H5410_005900 [Solanum commersonii]|uniref:H15 domain-containing protein n=1 Tax=Solanum commersonii TaxID=4109 RepID=A0A9J6A8R6_SOLCO|nr:hypothetical protein H5410_005900 [Solanum commersonii]
MKKGILMKTQYMSLSKKEYDSLSRAHMTLLKHHLQKMFEKGEVIMIDGGRFCFLMTTRTSFQKEEDPQHEVHLEQPIKQCRGWLAKYKKDGAKINDSTINMDNKGTKRSMITKIFIHSLTVFYLSFINHTTHVNPPYTWMIEKVLHELDEEGDSNEDSIYEFIKKEYDSLSRAHMTLLKHHLQKMFEKREVIIIDGGRFCFLMTMRTSFQRVKGRVREGEIHRLRKKKRHNKRNQKIKDVRELSRARRTSFIEILYTSEGLEII